MKMSSSSIKADKDRSSDESSRSSKEKNASYTHHTSRKTSTTVLPDYKDDPNAQKAEDAIIRSFYDIKRKTMRSLYGLSSGDDKKKKKNTSSWCYDHRLLMDKSPKGSVDEPIRPLVDLLNSHPSFATLSSCSGRIALFDPNFGALKAAAGSSAGRKGRAVLSDGRGDGGDGGDGGDDGVDAADGSATHDSPREDINRQPAKDGGDSVSEDNDNDNDNAEKMSGKGQGAWLIASHQQITYSLLHEALAHHSKASHTAHHQPQPPSSPPRQQALVFKHEPLLLHIATSNRRRARQLLALALNAGFRESGLMDTNKRTTVAIRTHALSLTVPIASAGRLRPNDEYLRELVSEANDRFERNGAMLGRLHTVVRDTFFREVLDSCLGEQTDTAAVAGNTAQQRHSSSSLNVTRQHTLPSLNLWGHAAVNIPINARHTNTPSTDSNRHHHDVQLIVYGGYGTGPSSSSTPNHTKQRVCARSNKIFTLCRRSAIWDHAWTEIPSTTCAAPSHDKYHGDLLQERQHSFAGLACRQLPFTAREGHAACIPPILSNTTTPTPTPTPTIVAIFGGRASPQKPTDSLLLTQHQPDANTTIQPLTFYQPTDVRGKGPSPRWAHSFLALSPPIPPHHHHHRPLALVVGGRDTNNVLSSVHLLSAVRNASITTTGDDDPSTTHSHHHSLPTITHHLLWETLTVSIPRFHHSTLNITTPQTSSSNANAGCDSQHVFIFGGLSSIGILQQSQRVISTTQPILLSIRCVHAQAKDDESVYNDCGNAAAIGGDVVSLVSPLVEVTTYEASPSPLSVFGAAAVAACSVVIPSNDYADYKDDDATPPADDAAAALTTAPRSHIIVTGGIPHDNDDDDAETQQAERPALNCVTFCHSTKPIPQSSSSSSSFGIVPIRNTSDVVMDCGSLVHHVALDISSAANNNTNGDKREIVLLGGGVPSFSFGPSFARSYYLELQHPTHENNNSQSDTKPPTTLAPPISNLPKTTTTTVPKSSNSTHETNVLYVMNKNAKQLKNALESLNYLDRTYRMTKAVPTAPVEQPNIHIAVPINIQCLNAISAHDDSTSTADLSWLSIVVSRGRQGVPYSTSVLGNTRR